MTTELPAFTIQRPWRVRWRVRRRAWNQARISRKLERVGQHRVVGYRPTVLTSAADIEDRIARERILSECHTLQRPSVLRAVDQDISNVTVEAVRPTDVDPDTTQEMAAQIRPCECGNETTEFAVVEQMIRGRRIGHLRLITNANMEHAA